MLEVHVTQGWLQQEELVLLCIADGGNLSWPMASICENCKLQQPPLTMYTVWSEKIQI